jgi:hypothetical protein
LGERRRIVAEVVQPDRRDTGLERQPLELASHRRRVQGRPVLPGEDLPGLHPRLTPRKLIGLLLLRCAFRTLAVPASRATVASLASVFGAPSWTS